MKCLILNQHSCIKISADNICTQNHIVCSTIFLEVKCPGINVTTMQDNLGLVMPDVSTADDIPFGESVIFNCTIPSDNPQTYTRSQKCVYDFNEHIYKLIGDSLECKSKLYNSYVSPIFY